MEDSIEVLKILGIFSYFKNMADENSRWKNIDESRNYFVEEIEQKELISKMHKKVCTTPNYIEHFLIYLL